MTLTPKQEEAIMEVMRLRKDAMAYALVDTAKEMATISVEETLVIMTAAGYSITVVEGITDAIVQEYTSKILQGGTDCIERVLTQEADGLFRATTQKTFVPWLNDMSTQQTKEILELIAESEKARVHPTNIAKKLEKYFEGTKHNAMTAARTEASKIRNDARSVAMTENGVQYVQYITAEDSDVRPEHAMRHGKIYRHENAPWLGEYNCRCLLAPADYLVNRKGAAVTDSDAEYLTPEEAGVQ